MTNAFERHGLDHLSASSINLFVAQPAMWAMQKLLGHKSRVGAAAHRGTAVEAGVEMGLFDHSLSLEACQEVALAKFNQLTALSADPNVEKERAGIASAVAIALGDPRTHLAHVASIARSIERFLSLSDDGAELTAALSPDLDSFYWKDPGSRSAAQEIWGLAPEAAPQV